MRIALFLESSHGGGFQQSLSTIESLLDKGSGKHEFVIFTPLERTRLLLRENGINAIRVRQGVFRLLDRWSSTAVGGAICRRLQGIGFRRLGRHLDALLEDHRIDLVLLTETVDSALRIGDHPFIVTVLDLDHRDYPEFPEIYSSRGFERLDRPFANALTRAVAVIANSPWIARRIAGLYQVDPDRIIELPFVPASVVRRRASGEQLSTVQEVCRKYDLPGRYVFYPAGFHAFKNHLYILEGLVALQRKHQITIDAVFCGGVMPNTPIPIRQQVQELGLEKHAHFLGFVPDRDIPALYEGAFALVMPAYNGPTNLPPLEAVTLGCPVICSDLPGCREQMGDAALYCDLSDSSSLADQLAGLINDPGLSAKLRKAGATLAAEISKIDYGERMAALFDNYAYVRRRWAWPEMPK